MDLPEPQPVTPHIDLYAADLATMVELGLVEPTEPTGPTPPDDQPAVPA